jgi:hypothetical protein
MKFKVLCAIAACAALLQGSAAVAGVFTDDLGRCLVNSTTKEDRVNLIRWLFVAASHHPAVKPIATVTSAQQEESDRQMGCVRQAPIRSGQKAAANALDNELNGERG